MKKKEATKFWPDILAQTPNALKTGRKITNVDRQNSQIFLKKRGGNASKFATKNLQVFICLSVPNSSDDH